MNTGKEIVNPVSWSWRSCCCNYSCSDHSLHSGWGDCSCSCAAAATAGWLVSSLAVFTELLLMTRRSRSSLFSIWKKDGITINLKETIFRCTFWELKWSVYQKVITCFQADSFGLASLGWHISLWVFCLYIEFMYTYYSTMVYFCRYSTQKCRFSVCIVHLFILPTKDTS